MRQQFFLWLALALSWLSPCVLTATNAPQTLDAAMVSHHLERLSTQELRHGFYQLRDTSRYHWPTSCSEKRRLFLTAADLAVSRWSMQLAADILSISAKNCGWDNSPTSYQMLSLLGLAYAHLEDRTSSNRYYAAILRFTDSAEYHANAHLRLGWNYLKTRQLDSARLQLDAALEGFNQHFGPDSKEYAHAYYLKGMTFYYAGQLTEAFTYYRQALSHYAAAGVIYDENRGNLLHRIALARIAVGEYREAVRLIEAELGIYEVLHPAARNLAFNAVSDLGLCHTYLGNYAKADSLYRRSAVQAASLGEAGLKNNYNLISLAYNQEAKGDWSAAIQHYKSCISQLETDYGQVHPEIATLYARLANCYLAQGNLTMADHQSQKALSIITHLDERNETPERYRIEPTFARGLYLHRRYRQNGQLETLNEALHFINRGTTQITRLKDGNAEFSVMIGFKKHMIAYIQRSVGVLAAAYAQTGEERELYNLIGLAEQLKTDRLSAKRCQSHNWAERGAQNVAEVQARLLPGQSVLYYFQDDRHVYRIEIGAGQLQLTRGPALAQLNPLLRAAVKAISDRAPLEQLHSLLEEIGDQLLPPELAEKHQGLVVVPYDELSRLPFDLLRTQGEYLIHRGPVSYAASLRLLGQQKEGGQSIGSGRVAVLNPATSTEQEQFLPGVSRELRYLRQHFQTTDFQLDQLSENRGKSVLHLSTHGHISPVNGGGSYLLTGDAAHQRLYARDVERLQLDADLVILSSCGTGDGALYPGQGILSFGRSFHLAGVPAAIIAHWEIPDLATAAIIPRVYEQLAAGKNKDEALRTAKLEFLQNEQLLAYRHPFYWAGLSLQGNTSPVRLSRKKSTGWWLVPIIFCLLLLLVFWARTRVQSED